MKIIWEFHFSKNRCILIDMNDGEIRKNIPWLIWQLFFSAKPELYGMSEAHDLTILQMFAVCLLEPDHEVPMNSLSGMLHCDASNVTGIVDKLVSLSLVNRQESTKDRRIKIIKLTVDGLILREELLKRMSSMSIPDLSVLSKQEQETLSGLLLKLLADKP